MLDENAYFREVDVRLPRVRLDHAVRGLDPAAALDALRGGARAGESAGARAVEKPAGEKIKTANAASPPRSLALES